MKNKEEGDYLYLACLYNNAFTDKIGEEYNHFVILTMDAAKEVAHIHDRMPVFLNEKTKAMWLDPNVPFQKCLSEISTENKMYEMYKGLEYFEVGTLVNSIKHDNSECILPK